MTVLRLRGAGTRKKETRIVGRERPGSRVSYTDRRTPDECSL